MHDGGGSLVEGAVALSEGGGKKGVGSTGGLELCIRLGGLVEGLRGGLPSPSGLLASTSLGLSR